MYVYSELFLYHHSLRTQFSIILKNLIIIIMISSFGALGNMFSKEKVSGISSTCSCLPVPHQQALLRVINNCFAQLKAVGKESIAPSSVDEKTLINVYGNRKPTASTTAVGRKTVNLRKDYRKDYRNVHCNTFKFYYLGIQAKYKFKLGLEMCTCAVYKSSLFQPVSLYCSCHPHTEKSLSHSVHHLE